jgi:hypothetical protein
VSNELEGGIVRLPIPSDLAVAGATDCRQTLVATLATGTGPAEIEFVGEGRVGAVALQLGLSAAAALRAEARTAVFGPNARAELVRQGLGGGT